MKSVLVVDDEQAILTLLTYNLEKAGFQVDSAMDGATAFDKARYNKYEFILLDLMLPKMDGLEVTRRLRQEKIETPIMILTAKDDEFDKVVGLELGADDYLTKPFSPREVIARIKAISRRVEHHDEGSDKKGENKIKEEDVLLEMGPIKVDQKKHRVFLKGNLVEISPKAYELLIYFLKHPEQVMTRDNLLNGVWGYDFVGETRMVDVQISYLRERLEENPKKPKLIKTVRGFGYRLEEPK